MTAWTITADYILDPEVDTSAVGAHRPGPRHMVPLQIERHPLARQFRLRDADGTLYYEGFCVADGEELFAPLDDFGTPNAGCTTIEYRTESGEWEPL